MLQKLDSLNGKRIVLFPLTELISKSNIVKKKVVSKM